VLSLVAVLFVAAYAESLLRSIRRGRRRVAGPAGLAVIGALGGAALVGLAWAAGTPAHPATVVACAGLTAAAGLVAARAARLVHLARRVHP
jgi:serine/threonine-protein kinase